MDQTTPRSIADAFVETLADLDPLLGTRLGIRPGVADLPDFSPAGHAALTDARRATLARLDAVEARANGALPAVERRAARLLRERLTAQLALDEAGEHLREVSNFFTPIQRLRDGLILMPKATDDDWATLGRRLRNVPAALDGYLEALDTGAAKGLLAAARQVETAAEQLDALIDADWCRELTAPAPESLRAELDAAAGLATAALDRVRVHLRETYLPAAAGTPDGVGRERYRLTSRYWTGADLDLDDAYAYGWEEFHRVAREMREAAALILPGGTPQAAMAHLDRHGEAVEGVEEIRAWLQALMDEAIAELDGTHLDVAEPVRTVEAMIAPPGSAAAPYYTRPSLDFSRPGRTWLPTMGATRFPVWSLVSTWYHEGVPGHHFQLAQWLVAADDLSRYQTGVGSVSATTEGWALYAERLMDELGHLTDPGRRLGYLVAQMTRAIRVIIDIGVHLGLRVPAGEAFHPGEVWTPALAAEFFRLHTGREPAYVTSELVRYLGAPGQAISYKLGERAWVAGREAARAARGTAFDLKAWHMSALSLGSLGLDDLTEELAAL
ncbi:DUF885 domain-containing protein [Streptomyces radicis]|uniref:DUF885 domain-containing protein n=1 Tax=Streptomyces radicis TaxID=1750517 RepID=A0A3A9WUD7_9ACTN|nr:DUF885 domain-containing protein [Streptomyces radicis]RKN11406.1 DUF885 domain-containing protein [Streptomyces radicis]RKN26575.1 DUF885 domain-containing protein [Streptomyces radicis]